MGSAEYVEPVVNYIENYEHSLRMEAASKQAIHFRSIWNVSKCLFVNASKCLFFTHIHSSRLIPISSCFFSSFSLNRLKIRQAVPLDTGNFTCVSTIAQAASVYVHVISGKQVNGKVFFRHLYLYLYTCSTTHYRKYFRCCTNRHSQIDSLIAIHLWMQCTLWIVVRVLVRVRAKKLMDK